MINMRDVLRIGRILEDLEEAWRMNPDLRLGQLLHNLAMPNSDLYNIEDTEWAQLIRNYIKTGKFRS